VKTLINASQVPSGRHLSGVDQGFHARVADAR
jgi:hypothetical protein